MYKFFLFTLSLVLLLNSCSSTPPKKLKISTTTWIGYTPLFYAKEKGWLKKLNIKLLNVSSLSENLYLYKDGNSDAYVGTQYEYSILKPLQPTLMPVISFDRSNGGDIILANTTLKGLKNTKKTIDAYLEIDSINTILLENFLQLHQLQNKKINYINKPQIEIASLKATSLSRPTIIVTYTPYNIDLIRDGFTEIASTKNSLDLLVIDFMFTTQQVYTKHRHQFTQLKTLIDKSIVNLHNDPKEFYAKIKPYILELSYDDFLHSLDTIIWINTQISKELKATLSTMNIPTKDLL